jgi:hypothetical protein
VFPDGDYSIRGTLRLTGDGLPAHDTGIGTQVVRVQNP